jgi:hypothetical protein
MISCCIQRESKIFSELENSGPKDGDYNLIQSFSPNRRQQILLIWLTFNKLHGTVSQKKNYLRLQDICHVKRNSHKNYTNYIYSDPAVIKRIVLGL